MATKILIDSNIPFIKGVFEPYFDVEYRSGAEITPQSVADADVMVIRTRTRCDASLLDGSRVGMIATATIGFDHIDTRYCSERGIAVQRAAGCNAYGVVQYVTAALVHHGITPGARVAVVGVGSVGGALAARLREWGFEVMMVDPPRSIEEGSARFVSLKEAVAVADVVTLHVPLTLCGCHRTEAMADDVLFGAMKRGALFINSSRGEVVVTESLKKALGSGQVKEAVIDVWEGEPAIDRELLSMAGIATPHIAGYSVQGKAAGTSMVVRAVAERYGITQLRQWWPDDVVTVDHSKAISWEQVCRQMPLHYDIAGDSMALKREPESFESLRNRYRYREEFF